MACHNLGTVDHRSFKISIAKCYFGSRASGHINAHRRLRVLFVLSDANGAYGEMYGINAMGYGSGGFGNYDSFERWISIDAVAYLSIYGSGKMPGCLVYIWLALDPTKSTRSRYTWLRLVVWI